jgi:hypothetical protein
MPAPQAGGALARGESGPEATLEHGEVLFFPKAPFPLPEGDDHLFLLRQSMGGAVHKNISYNPHTDTVAGFARRDPAQVERLRAVLARFSQAVRDWLPSALPLYQGGHEADRVSFRPEEEATRKLRRNARNDLLHVDAFPGRPAKGRRILRVFANINPKEPRVWATSDPLPVLLRQHRGAVEQASAGWVSRLKARIVDWSRPAGARREASDWFMLRLHDYLKGSDDFQQRCPRKLWYFPPGSVWLAMTDGCSHAVLRGCYALEHSFFIAPESLVCPEMAPARLLAAA